MNKCNWLKLFAMAIAVFFLLGCTDSPVIKKIDITVTRIDYVQGDYERQPITILTLNDGSKILLFGHQMCFKEGKSYKVTLVERFEWWNRGGYYLQKYEEK